MNLNELARKITLEEGKKIELPIAQVKEVMRLLLRELAMMPERESRTLLRIYRARLGK